MRLLQICFSMAVSWIGLSGVVVSETVYAGITKPLSDIGVQPQPPEILACRVKTDCVVINGVCGKKVVVNKKNEAALTQLFRPQDQATDCLNSKGRSKVVADCQKNVCEDSNNVGHGEMAIALWKDQCPPKELATEFEGLDIEVKNWVVALDSPLGWERRAALGELGKLEKNAEPVIPRILEMLKHRDSISSTNEARCVVGEFPSEEELIVTLGKINPDDHPALPLIIEWLKDEKQLYRHADALKHLLRMGRRAASSLEVLEIILEKSHANNWSEERGLLALDVVGVIGGGAKRLLPRLRVWLEKTKNQKARLLMTMLKIDPAHEITRQSALFCLQQKEDGNCRTLALHYMTRFPEDLAGEISVLKEMLVAPEFSTHRLGALKAVKGLGSKGKILVDEVARLVLQNQEDVRRQAALTLKSIDPEGKLSLGLLKKRVYQGFAFESQYAWKVIGSELTKLELLKSYYYFVTGKRYKFAELKVAPEMERQLVNCIGSKDCANRTSAMAAVVLLKSDDDRLPAVLATAMKSSDASIRWDAAGAYLLLYAEGNNKKPDEKELALAWSLQEEAATKGGIVRLIDLEDILLGLASSPAKVQDRVKFLYKKLPMAESAEVLDARVILAAQGAKEAKEVLIDVIKGTDKHKTLNTLTRLGLARVVLPGWIKDQLGALNKHPETEVQETALLNQMSLVFN
jgi:hypothetical protein